MILAKFKLLTKSVRRVEIQEILKILNCGETISYLEFAIKFKTSSLFNL
jgi:hypothetical protein